MACSVCGEKNHNSRTCPIKNDNKENRDHAFWFKVDNVTEEESREFSKELIDLKQRIAPEARATLARAKKSQLPENIKKALSLEGGSIDE